MYTSGFRVFITVCLFVLCAHYSNAQDLKYTVLNAENGLPSSEVYSVVQDDEGYIWGAGDLGLFRYNGKTVDVYTEADGLPSNVVYKLCKGPDGKIWMVSSNNQVAYVENGRVHRIPANKLLDSRIRPTVHEIANFKVSKNGDLCIGLYYGGCMLIPKSSAYSEVIHTKVPKDVHVLSISEDGETFSSSYTSRESALFVKGQRGKPLKIRVKNKDKEFQIELLAPLNSDELATRLCMLGRSNGDVLMIHSQYAIIFRELGKVRQIKMPSFITFAKIDRQGGLWLGVYKKGVHYYPNGNLEGVPQVFFEEFSITDVCMDYEGGFWFSSLENGVFYSPNLNFQNFDRQLNKAYITGLFAKDRKLYGSSLERHLFRLEEGKEMKSKFFGGSERSSKSQFLASGNSIFFTGFRMGKIDDDLQIPAPVQSMDINWNRRGTDFLLLEKGVFLSLNRENLVIIRNNRTQEISFLEQPGLTMHRLQSGEIWVGTTKGLCEVNTNLDWKRIFTNEPLLDTKLTCIVSSGQGRVAISSHGNGVLLYDGDKWVNISKEDGLSSRFCNFVKFRNNRELWVASNQGISRIRWVSNDIKSYSITNFSIEHGLSSNETTCLEFDGDLLWVGTRRGLTRIDLSKVGLNSIAPKIKLVQLTVNDRPKKYRKALALPHDQNALVIYFDILSFKNGSKTSLKYRFVGETTKFTALEGDVLPLPNLSPGHYKIEVLGVNSDGVDSSEPVVIEFEILPPFYGTWWFLGVSAFLGICVLFLLVRWRVRFQREKDRKRMELERKLSSHQLTAIRSQMNPHFIFNAFNGIQRYVLQKDKLDTYNYVNKFSLLIREVLEESANNYISLEKELEMLKTYVEIESLRFDNKFTYYFDELFDEDDLYHEIPSMIVQPFIENAIWHGLMPLEERVGELKVRFQIIAAKLQIQIIDNGVGRAYSKTIQKKAGASSMGIHLINERIQLVNSLTPNEQVEYWIEDVFDALGQAAGTTVHIAIQLNKQI